LELRTKSTQVRSLINQAPSPRCIVAFSLSPADVADKLEHKAPTLARRLEAIAKLQEQGWLIGLRFDPVIYQSNYQQQYKALFDRVFAAINLDRLHSVSLGLFRLPEVFFKKIHKLYPDEKLFASPLQQHNSMVAYQQDLEQEMFQYCKEQLLTHIPASKFFPCTI
jgi:spore photoproduct lyase